MNHNETLSPEERERILSDLHQRRTLEERALKEEKLERQREAERLQRAELERAAQKAEADRKDNISLMLNTSLKYLQEAITAFEQKDESTAYRLLVRCEEARSSAFRRLSIPSERPSATGGVPTIRVKAPHLPQGFMIINAEDLNPAHEVIPEDS